MLAATRRVRGSHGAIEGQPPVARPAGLAEREICALSGMPANRWCPARQREWLAAGDRCTPCSWHHLSDEGLLVVWPPEYRQWARQNGLLGDMRAVVATASPQVPVEENTPAPAKRPLEIVSPPSGAVYLIDPTLRREFQTVPLRVVTPRPGQIEWRINDRPLGTSSSESPVMWSLTPGTHRITVRTAAGVVAESTIVVR